MDANQCYSGGDIAGSIIGTLICGAIAAYIAYWLYKKYWNKRKGTHLVQEDPESAKGEYAFDNPAFKNDGTKAQTSPLDTKWMPKQNGNSMESKKKTQDDNAVSNTSGPPRIVALRGSDFTGLGIELCGGLKEGIFVKKVMPQGPAAGVVNLGDRITSITIDFMHIVQEDAMTILSYASPYNVKLELVDGKQNASLMNSSNSPNSAHSSLTHPLYRSSSQSDMNTIERNTRKNLFPEERESNNSQKQSPKQLPTVHKENEIKSKASSLTKQFKGLIEEKLQNRSNDKHKDEVDCPKPTSPTTEEGGKKGLKFGIRVLPPNVNEKLFGKSPTKADNDNNTNLEKVKTPEEMDKPAFDRQNSITSSGIKRDSAGIPQEMPEHMMQAALSAKEHRKTNSTDSKKGKGKAPKPPPVEIDMNISTETVDTTLDINSPRPMNMSTTSVAMNFTDNFNEMPNLDDSMTEQPSNSSTPKSERKKHPSDTESQIHARYDNDSGAEDRMDSTQIELSAKEITVHQTSEEEDGDDNRKAASLGDLSKLDGIAKGAGPARPSNGTLERAQSLEIAEPNQHIANAVVTPKKRKAPVTDSDYSEKEPRLSMDMDLDSLDTLQRGRLRSAYEWGNLEDAISNKESVEDSRSSDTESSERMDEMENNMKLNASTTSFEQEVMAVMENEKEELKKVIENEIEKPIVETTTKIFEDTVPMKTMEHLLKEKLEEAKAALDTTDDEDQEQKKYNETNYTTTTTLNGDLISTNLNSSVEEPEIVAEIKMNNGPSKTDDENMRNSVSFISPISFKFKVDDKVVEGRNPVLRLNSSGSGTPSLNADLSENVTDQVKIINYGTNMPDDVKVSRFPFGSLERPKSDVLKKLIAQKMVPLEDFATPEVNSTITTTTTTTIVSDPQPVSLTLIGGNPEEDESIQEDPIASQTSPIYSSDNKGVNSISISSMEVNIGPQTTTTNGFGNSNVVTISTNSELSQPSSIILIDDEKLDFTLQTPPSEINDDYLNRPSSPSPPIPPLPSVEKLKDEVFIVDTQPKKITKDEVEKQEDAGEMLSDQDVLDALKTFVTEIQVQNDKQGAKTDETNRIDLESTEKFLEQEKLSAAIRSPTHSFIPRNTEIKFTTSTYEASSPRITATLNGNSERRHSSIDQIRSNFERNASNSDIPVPVRKSSIPTLKMSPSKIPVFNSATTNNNNNNNSLVNNNNGKADHQPSSMSPTHRYSSSPSSSPVSPNANNNRVSVTVTSIKNSARHPSGK